MNILAVNCGSSTMKFQFFAEEEGETVDTSPRQRLASGVIDNIGSGASLHFNSDNGGQLQKTAAVADHGAAIRLVLDWLGSTGILAKHPLGAVGHRVVHGGDRFVEPALIDDDVIDAIEALSQLAPLHNEPSLQAINAARALLGDAVPMVAVFDTAFHRAMPDRARQYAIPRQLAATHQVQRYGFHGLAHRYMTQRYASITSTPRSRVNIVTLQLGNGCSAAAIEGGASIDTSMGFTPLEGLMMGTRSGDIDPSVLGFLADQERVSTEEVEGWLNTRSGLLGVSGLSRDMRALLSAERAGDTGAGLAVDMFCYRVRKYIGAYMAALGGADAVVFGGGIGENAPAVRDRICWGMEWCGLRLDGERNAKTVGVEQRISVDEAAVHAFVIPVDEAAIIAEDTAACLRHHE